MRSTIRHRRPTGVVVVVDAAADRQTDRPTGGNGWMGRTGRDAGQNASLRGTGNSIQHRSVEGRETDDARTHADRQGDRAHCAWGMASNHEKRKPNRRPNRDTESMLVWTDQDSHPPRVQAARCITSETRLDGACAVGREREIDAENFATISFTCLQQHTPSTTSARCCGARDETVPSNPSSESQQASEGWMDLGSGGIENAVCNCCTSATDDRACSLVVDPSSHPSVPPSKPGGWLAGPQ